MILTAQDRSDLLAKLKKDQTLIATLFGALPSMRLVLAWPFLKILVPTEPIEIDEKLSDVERVWAGVAIDMEEVAVAARIPFSMIENHVKEAQILCWVWPDGTVSENAANLAKATITRLAKGKEKGTQ